MPNPDVSLETHDDGGVDRGHHGDLDDGQEVGQDDGIDVPAVVEPQVGQAVHQRRPSHHKEVGESKDLEKKRKKERGKIQYLLIVVTMNGLKNVLIQLYIVLHVYID